MNVEKSLLTGVYNGGVRDGLICKKDGQCRGAEADSTSKIPTAEIADGVCDLPLKLILKD
jgi:hypothetical protein